MLSKNFTYDCPFEMLIIRLIWLIQDSLYFTDIKFNYFVHRMLFDWLYMQIIVIFSK